MNDYTSENLIREVCQQTQSSKKGCPSIQCDECCTLMLIMIRLFHAANRHQFAEVEARDETLKEIGEWLEQHAAPNNWAYPDDEMAPFIAALKAGRKPTGGDV